MSQDPMAVSLEDADALQATELAEATQAAEAQHHLVAVFESTAHAGAARDALAQSGIDPASAHVVDRHRAMHDMEDAAQTGAWGAARPHPPPAGIAAGPRGLDHLPLPHDDLHEYAKLVDEGYALLVVRGDAAAGYHVTGQILERHRPVDFEAMLARWRNDGWATPAQAAAVPVALPAHVPEAARMASILIQRGQGAAPQNQEPEVRDGYFRYRPEIAAPDPVAGGEASPDYAQANHQEAVSLPDTGPTRRERRLVRDFVAHQSITGAGADTAGRGPSAGPPIRVYRPHHA